MKKKTANLSFVPPRQLAQRHEEYLTSSAFDGTGREPAQTPDPLDELVIMHQLLLVRRLAPLKAYCLKYKFFEAPSPASTTGARVLMSEGDIVQQLVHQDKILNVDRKFDKKVQETIADVVQ